MFRLAVGLLGWAAFACAADGPVLKFDLGWKDLPAPEGFVKVTKEDVYKPDKGWGFRGPVHWGGYAGRFPHSPKVCHKILDEISRDGLRVTGTFAVDVPNGTYLVWGLEGDLGSYALHPIQDHLSYGVTIEGQVLRQPVGWDRDAFLKEYFRWLDHDYQRGEDVYEEFVLPLMDELTATAPVRDGQLTLACRDLNLSALMVYPSSMGKEFEAETTRLRQRRREFFDNVVNVREPEFQGEAAPITESERRQGYRIWPRHRMKPVHVNTAPEPDEAAAVVKAWAARNQTETVTFAVRPLTQLQGVRVEVDDLVLDKDAKIRKEQIEVRVLQYRVGPNGLVVRSHLPAFTSADLAQGITKQFWLTFPVPPAARPGVYCGRIVFRPANRPAAELPLKVKVLPIDLPSPYECATFVTQTSRPARYFYQMSHMFPGEFVPAFRWVVEHHKRLGLLPQIRDIAAKTIDFEKPTQRVEYDPRALKEFCDLIDIYAEAFPGVPVVVAMHHTFGGYWIPRKRGANGWPLSEQSEHTWKAMREYVAGYEELRSRRPKWPEFYYVGSAEMSNGGRDHVLYGKKCLEALKSVPGVTAIACPNGAFEARTYAPLVDIIAPNFAVPMTDQAFEGLPNAQTRLWMYQGFNRFSYGFYTAKTKYSGGFKEFYCTANQRPYNTFDGVDLWVNCALSTPDGMVSMPNLEEFSWGVTDLRYVKALQRLIERAKRSGKPAAAKAAAAAAAFLTEFLDDINPDLDYYMNQAGFWDWSVYDTYRWMVAEQILALGAEL